MGDETQTLERVGRPDRPARWIGAWIVGLAAVIAIATIGRGPVEDLAAVPAATPAPMASSAPIPGMSPRLPDYIPRIIRPRTAVALATPRPVPTLGDDGLVGGTAYSSPVPVGWEERSARANGQ